MAGLQAILLVACARTASVTFWPAGGGTGLLPVFYCASIEWLSKKSESERRSLKACLVPRARGGRREDMGAEGRS